MSAGANFTAALDAAHAARLSEIVAGNKEPAKKPVVTQEQLRTGQFDAKALARGEVEVEQPPEPKKGDWVNRGGYWEQVK